MNIAFESIREHWIPISHLLSVNNDGEYDKAVRLLNSLIDEVGTDDRNPLYEFLDTLGTVINAYEEHNYPMPDCEGIGMLCFFMNEHRL